MIIQYHMQSSLFHIVSVYHKHTEFQQPQLLTTLRPSCNGIPPSLPVTSFSWSRVDARRCTLACFAGRRRWRPTLRATKAPAMDAAAVVAVGKDEAFAWPAIQVTTQNSSSQHNMKLHTLRRLGTSWYSSCLSFMTRINLRWYQTKQMKMIHKKILYYLMWGVMWLNSAHNFMMEFDPLNSMPWAGWTTGETCVFRLRPGATKATAMLRGRDLLRDVRKVRLRQTTNAQKMRRVMIQCTQEHS